MKQQTTDKANKLAKEHADWFLTLFGATVRPLLISFMIHGYKHGIQEKDEPELDPTIFGGIGNGTTNQKQDS